MGEWSRLKVNQNVCLGLLKDLFWQLRASAFRYHFPWSGDSLGKNGEIWFLVLDSFSNLYLCDLVLDFEPLSLWHASSSVLARDESLRLRDLLYINWPSFNSPPGMHTQNMIQPSIRVNDQDMSQSKCMTRVTQRLILTTWKLRFFYHFP